MKKRLFVLMMTLGLMLSACGETKPAEPQVSVVVENVEREEITPADTKAEEEPQTAGEEPEATEVPAPTEAPSPTEALAAEEAEDNGMIDVQVALKDTIPDTDAMRFTKAMKVGWNLGNCFDAHSMGLSNEMDYETAWCKAKVTKELILELKNAGFNTIRVPVSWHDHVDKDNNISEKWLDRVEEVVKWIYEEDMYVIVNIHHDNDNAFYPSYDKFDKSDKYIKDIWTQLADRFADYDEHLIFETMNEPRQTGTDHEWWINDKSADYAKESFDCINKFNQTAVNAIRNGKGHNNERYVMIPGYCAAPEFELYKDFRLPQDPGAADHLIISAHAYTPYDFALNRTGTNDFDIETHRGTSDIDSFTKNLYIGFIIKGIPVVISEWGSLDKNNLDSRLEFSAYYVTKAGHYGMPTILWDNNAYRTDGENFGIIDRASLNWIFPEIRDQIVYSAEHAE